MWKPQEGPQELYVGCNVREIFFGGARGGGKSDAILGKALLKAQAFGDGFNAVIFRREIPSLDDLIERSMELYSGLAKWHDQKKTWRFHNGARLRFRPLETIKDAMKYKGQNISDIYVDEADDYPDPAPIFRLFGVMRSAKGVPTQITLTGNPGGPGHTWLKNRYVKEAPSGGVILETKVKDLTGADRTLERIFIPSKVENNQILLENDPEYILRLQQSGSEALVQAWLKGDWDAIEGAFFDCWSADMIIEPFKIPDNWTRFRSMDWGSAAPFSVGWWAIAQDDYKHKGVKIRRGALVRYREWYGARETEAGTYRGLKMTAEQVADGIKLRELEHIEGRSVIDPSAFKQDGGPSIAERMYERGVTFSRADNKRIASKDSSGPMGGWDQMRERMRRKMIFCFNTCVDSIRTIPALPHDPDRPEDLDTKAEDHAADDWRYACMSRPLLKETEKPKPKVVGFIDTGIKKSDTWQRI